MPVLTAFSTLNPKGRIRPVGNFKINWSHPLTANLAGCWLPGPGLVYNLVNGQVGTRHGTGAIENVGKFGAQYDPNNNNGADTNWIKVSNGAIIAGLASFSIVAFTNGVAPGVGLNDATIYSERAASGNDILKIDQQGGGGGTSGAIQFTYRNDGGTLLQLNHAGTNASGSYHVFGVSKNGGVTNGTQVFYDGVLQAQATWSSNDTFTNANISTIGDDSAGAFSSGYKGPILFVAVWKRSLSNVEQLSISTDPFQFLLPDESEMPAISAAAAAGARFRRTLSSIGTRTGSRQAVMQ